MGKLKSSELREKKTGDLKKQLDELKNELSQVRRAGTAAAGPAGEPPRVGKAAHWCRTVEAVADTRSGSVMRLCAQSRSPRDTRRRENADAHPSRPMSVSTPPPPPSQLRVAQVTAGAASKLSKIKLVRKNIARVLTAINTKAKAGFRKEVQTMKLTQVPKQLRAKKTRSLRRALSATDVSVSPQRVRWVGAKGARVALGGGDNTRDLTALPPPSTPAPLFSPCCRPRGRRSAR